MDRIQLAWTQCPLLPNCSTTTLVSAVLSSPIQLRRARSSLMWTQRASQSPNTTLMCNVTNETALLGASSATIWWAAHRKSLSRVTCRTGDRRCCHLPRISLIMAMASRSTKVALRPLQKFFIGKMATSRTSRDSKWLIVWSRARTSLQNRDRHCLNDFDFEDNQK